MANFFEITGFIMAQKLGITNRVFRADISSATNDILRIQEKQIPRIRYKTKISLVMTLQKRYIYRQSG